MQQSKPFKCTTRTVVAEVSSLSISHKSKLATIAIAGVLVPSAHIAHE